MSKVKVISNFPYKLREFFVSSCLGGKRKNNKSYLSANRLSHKATKSPSFTKANLSNSNSCETSVNNYHFNQIEKSYLFKVRDFSSQKHSQFFEMANSKVSHL